MPEDKLIKKDHFLAFAVDLSLFSLFFHFYSCHLQHSAVMSSTALIMLKYASVFLLDTP